MDNEIKVSVDVVLTAYLHQSLGIVPSPLTEIPPLFEST